MFTKVVQYSGDERAGNPVLDLRGHPRLKLVAEIVQVI
jgi:hypothetical protein